MKPNLIALVIPLILYKMTNFDISKIKPVLSFTKNGFNTYIVQLNVIGIENDLFLLCAGNSPDEAYNVAIEIVSMIKINDIELVNVLKLVNKEDKYQFRKYYLILGL